MSSSNEGSGGRGSPGSEASRPFTTPQTDALSPSAVTIQCWGRRFLAKRQAARRKLETEQAQKDAKAHTSAVLIQAIVKGLLVRRKIAFQKAAVKLTIAREKKEVAACTIQAQVRCKQQRERVSQQIHERRERNEACRREEAARVVQSSLRSINFRRTVLAAMEANTIQRREEAVARAAADVDEDTAELEASVMAQEQEHAKKVLTAAVARMQVRRQREAKETKERFYQQKAVAQEAVIQQKSALCIQQGFRSFAARREVSLRRDEVKKQCHEVRKGEGFAVLRRFYFKVSGRRMIRDRGIERAEREAAKKVYDSASLIQANVKGRQQHRKYQTVIVAERARILREAATRIQCLYRMRRAHIFCKEERFRRQVKEDTAQIHDAATSIQRLRRGQTARRRVVFMKSQMFIAHQVAALARAFMVRRDLGVSYAQDRAAKILQRKTRAFIATCHTKRLKKADLAHRHALRRDQAAVLIRRTWLKHQGSIELEERKKLRAKENSAARVIQHKARVLIARVQRRTLEEEEEEDNFMIQLENAVTVVQTCVRKYIAKCRLDEKKSVYNGARDLLRRVVQGYQDRVFQGKRRRLLMAQDAVAVISLGWRKYLEIKEARETMQNKRSELDAIKREKNAATLIQQQVRGFIGRKAIQKLKNKREEASKKLARQAKVFLAKKRADMLRRRVLEHRCARKVQVRWQEVKEGCRERREAREMETRLVDMELVAIFRLEDFHRRGVAAAEEELRINFKKEYEDHLEATATKFERKMAAWRKRSPADLQQDAAVRVQSAFRGFTTRKETLGDNSPMRGCLVRNNSFTRARRDLLPSLRLTSSVTSMPESSSQSTADGKARPGSAGDRPSARGTTAPPSPLDAPPLSPKELAPPAATWDGSLSLTDSARRKGLVGSDSMSWLSWLADRPEVNKRSFERLLQREAAGRRRIWEDFEADFTTNKDADKNAATTTTTLAPPSPALVANRKKSAVRHLAALSTAEQLTRRANAALSLHPTVSAESTQTISHMVSSYDIAGRGGGATSGSSAQAGSLEQGGGETVAVVSADGVADLRNKNLTEALLRPLLHSLRANEGLHALLLDGNPLRDTAALDVGDLLIHSTSLKHISMASTSLSDIGMSHLVAAMRRNTTLVSLDISGTCVSERYRSHLHSLLELKAMQRKRMEEERKLAEQRELAFGRETPVTTSLVPPSQGRAPRSRQSVEQAQAAASALSPIKLPPVQRYVPPAAQIEVEGM